MDPGDPPERRPGAGKPRDDIRMFGEGPVRWLATQVGAVLVLAVSVSAVLAASPNGLAVEVIGASEPVLCAEKDNVTVTFASSLARSFRIEAAHPAYIGMLQKDSFEADWTACDMKNDPAHASAVTAPTRKTLYEEPGIWVVGWTFPTYWRPATATVRIGDRIESGLHLLQVWMIRPMGGEEVLVVYPQDGYWRLRPLAPEGRAPTAFGSSFLLGPVEVEGRPIVKIKEIAFEPKTRTFTLDFARGGSATVAMSRTDHNRHTLEVAFDKPVTGVPFAAVRSMYVTEFNNDVARLAILEKGPQGSIKGWREEPVMAFKKALATDVWLGRTSPSRHNTSSPDMVFGPFSSEPQKTPASTAPPPAK